MAILLAVVSYCFGAVPFGLFIGKMAGVDVRTAGSKNIGATNVSRLLGKKYGLITLACDCAKGYLPMLLASLLLAGQPERDTIVVLCGILAVVGHMFPVYLGFKGGKGVATGLGVFLFLSPLAILLSVLVFVAAVAISGFVSVGSLLASLCMVFWLWILKAPNSSMVAAAIVALLIWIKHYQNIGRLLRKEEKSWRNKKEA